MPHSETQPVTKEMSKVDAVVDVHAHFVPVGLIEAVVDRPNHGVAVRSHGDARYSFEIEGSPPTRVLPPRLIDLETRQEWMDDQGIDLQVLGTWADIFGYGLSSEQGAEWARLVNETLIEAISDSSRFAAFATLPMQDPMQAAEMIPEVMEQGFVGVTVAARIGDVELDAPELDVFWRALDEAEATVFIHPGYAPNEPRTAGHGMVNSVGRPLDTTIAVSRLLGAGVARRHPGTKILLAHGGGAVAFILGRLHRNFELDPSVGDPGDGIGRLHFDSVVFDPDALCYLVAKAGPSHVLLGSDYPFPIGDPAPRKVVDSAGCLSDEERQVILGGAAVSLLGIRR
jgi:aminocarboxymuconate-semialdehyde decarboxylase